VNGQARAAASALIPVFLAVLSSAPPVPAVQNIPYADARPVLDSLRADLLPAELSSKSPHEREAAWRGWVSGHDRAIRARVQQGDRDSIVNLLLFGTSFTRRPRASGADLAALSERGRDALPLFAGRLDDLAAGIASPGSNERLQFARRFVERLGIAPASGSGRTRLREYLADGLLTAPAELNEPARQAKDAATHGRAAPDVLQSTLFRHRGLSTDTSLLADFALDQAIGALKATARLTNARGIRRVGIVGPGLDFTDKHDGHDFYPEQTIQPFAVVESLVRRKLASVASLRLTTFDLSPRVIEHLGAAGERSGRGEAYGLALPRNMDLPWSPLLIAYWERFGDSIGAAGARIAVPPTAGDVEVRSIRIDAAVVRSIVPRDVNIVLQRLDPLPDEERFDLIVATDVLVYYDVFEQSLALANIAHMLRTGGILLSNTRLFELPALPLAGIGSTDVLHMTLPILGDVRDRIFWYQRQ
jgi:hypothetical protein